jgi:hypothetical protein
MIAIERPTHVSLARPHQLTESVSRPELELAKMDEPFFHPRVP